MEKLRNKRLEMGITQEELAEVLGMDQSQYSRRERGQTPILTVEWERLANKLQCDVEDIYQEPAPSVIINNENANGEYSGSNNHFSYAADPKIVEKLMNYIELLEAKIESIQSKM